jgi:hypothetical protein
MCYISDEPKAALELQEFDFMIVRYRWFDTSGLDLDTSTRVYGTDDPLIDEDWVGYSKGPVKVGDPGEPYLHWGGDNQASVGEEQVLVNFKKLSEDYPTKTLFYSDLSAYWYRTLLDGVIEFEFETYLGGTMAQVGLGFENTGGEQVDLVTYRTVLTFHQYDVPQGPSSIFEELLGTINYNSITKVAQLIPK